MKSRMMMSLLGLSTMGSLLIATASVLVLNPGDRISITRGTLLTALGFVFFLSLFDFFNAVFLKTNAGQKFRKKYSLTVGDVLDITNKLVSAVQAAFCCVTGAIICLWSCTTDFIKASHYMSEAYAWFGAAYFFYDIWSMYKVHIHMTTDLDYFKEKPQKRPAKLEEIEPKRSPSFFKYCAHEPMILMHHLFIGGFGFLVIVYLRGGLGDCVFGYCYLMELSTPFVSLRGILSRMKLKASKAYLVNGLLMLGTFFVCRICSMPYVMLEYSRVLGVSFFEAMNSLPTGCKISICILLIPQCYWFYLMSMGALKVFLKKNKTLADKKVAKSS